MEYSSSSVGMPQLGNASQQFARDIMDGLRARPKYLPSKYLYNKKGDAIFQQIMELEEYYPTRCEWEVFALYKEHFLQNFTSGYKKFNLIEFGAGDGQKTKVLLQHFLEKGGRFRYTPIDISANIVQHLENDLHKNYPEMEVAGICEDYFSALEILNKEEQQQEDSHEDISRKVVLFLGSNIGNFTREEALDFLSKTNHSLRKGDQLLIGFDLKKAPEQILAAYNDCKGITKAFNLNLLDRINEQLEANFNLELFDHFPIYDPEKAVAKSYLVSLQEQNVYLAALDEVVHFSPWESIYMEKSQKYTLEGIREFAELTGFRVIGNFFDQKGYYVNSLWEI